MDEMSHRIQDHMHLVRRYKASNGSKLYKWGLTETEIDCHLYSALWQAIEYRDTHHDDLPEYQRFWRFARREFATVWKERNHVKGLPGASLYQISDEPDDREPDDSGDPADLASCLQVLVSLTDRQKGRRAEGQKGILSAIPGSGRQGRAIAYDIAGEPVQTAEKQLQGIRSTIKTGKAPNTQGIKEMIIGYLGIEPGKSASIRAKNVLAVARRELDLSIPRGSRYNRKQCEQIMGWLEVNARPQWFQANNPVQASSCNSLVVIVSSCNSPHPT
jgi:hypothetical protein